MYSGLVSEVGVIQSGRRTEEGILLTVHAPATAVALRPMGSVAVSGVCFTVVAVDGPTFSVLVGAESEARSTFRGGPPRPPNAGGRSSGAGLGVNRESLAPVIGSGRAGDELSADGTFAETVPTGSEGEDEVGATLDGRRVNLELPMRAGDPLDGHIVQGHVEGTARVVSRRRVGGVEYVWFRPNKRIIQEVIPKGSVAVDGVSLTVVEVNKGAFSVALIPETLRRTTLSGLVEGDTVNVETDLLPKYHQRFGHAPKPSLAWAGALRGPEAVEMAIAAIAAGGKVIVWDPAREGEGDVIMAADRVSPADINFYMTHVRGLLCVPADAEWLARLGIERIPGNGDHHGTAFMVPVDAARGVTTGIGATERAHTIRLLATAEATAASFVRPGHVFPLAAHPDGLLARPGHTEAAVALARWASRPPVALCCEIASANGDMARLPELELFAAEHELPLVTIEDLVAHARREAAAGSLR